MVERGQDSVRCTAVKSVLATIQRSPPPTNPGCHPQPDSDADEGSLKSQAAKGTSLHSYAVASERRAREEAEAVAAAHVKTAAVDQTELEALRAKIAELKSKLHS
eukprot:SAG31_NODE_320_length_17748_cov_4.201881_2_plen_105_part_00